MAAEPTEQEINRESDGKYSPGQSGNPAGRRPGTISLKAMLIEALSDKDSAEAKEVIAATIEDAKAGSVQARRLVFDYIEGKPRETLDATIDSVVRIVDDIE